MSPFTADANTYPNGSHCCPWQPLRVSDDTWAVSQSRAAQSWSPRWIFQRSKKKKKKGESLVHVGGSKCVNTATHGCRDLVWQEYMSFLAGHCEGGYSCWLWLQCKQSAGSRRGRVCGTEPSAAPKVLLIQRKGSFTPPITVTPTKTHAAK